MDGMTLRSLPFRAVSFPLILASTMALSATAGEWHVDEEFQAFHFETEFLQGRFVAQDLRDLSKGFGRHGFRDLIFKPTGEDLHAPKGAVGARRRHQGILNLYRVYSANETFGSLRDDQALVEQRPDGALLSWPATEERPVEIKATFRLTGPAQIDVEVTALAKQDFENFEILPASYFPVDMEKGIYRSEEGKAVLLRLGDGEIPGGDRPQYAFYPLSEAKREAQENSGRTSSSWIWPSYIPKELAALPIVFAESETTQVVLLGEPESVSAVCATPRPSSGNPEDWNSVQQHSALYFSLFAQDLKAGESCHARMRCIVARRSEDPASFHEELYRSFLAEGEN